MPSVDHINPSLRILVASSRDIPARNALTARFAPEVAATEYESLTWKALRVAYRKCWHVAVQRVCYLDNQLVGYASACAIGGDMWQEVINGWFNYPPFGGPIRILSAEELALSNLGDGCYLWIPDFGWDTSLSQALQVSIVRRMKDHLLRSFIGNRIKGFCVHSLPRYHFVSKEFGLRILSEHEDGLLIMGETGVRNHRDKYSPSVPDYLLTPPEPENEPRTADPSVQRAALTEAQAKTGRLLYEYEWEVEAVGATQGWSKDKNGRYSAYYTWVRMLKDALQTPDPQAYIQTYPWRICLGFTR